MGLFPQTLSAAISICGVDYHFVSGRPVFTDFSLELKAAEETNPTVILGPSGCGKTTLLRLIAGLLTPRTGEIITPNNLPVSFVFQEPRLLPWKTALENISLPLVEKLGKKAADEQARHFLTLVALENKAQSLPGELSGGQQQRVNLARAFACPSEILLMDEPFQSLDIPLRIQLMDLTLSLLERTPRLTVAVSHDPREAVYLGRRIIVLGESPRGIIHDEIISLSPEERLYGSAAQGAFEQRFLSLLS